MIALRLRLAPHRADSQNSTEILADCAIDHPFYVKDKGRKHYYRDRLKSVLQVW